MVSTLVHIEYNPPDSTDGLLVPGSPGFGGIEQPDEGAHHDVFIPQPIDTAQVRFE